MKVALVTYALNIGGLESVLLSLARGLRSHGSESTFVVTDSIGEWHGRPVTEGFQVESYIPSSWESRIGHAKRLAFFLAQFDVVLLNHSRSGQSSAGLLPDSSVVLSILHNDDEEIYRVGLTNAGNLDCVVTVGNRVQEEALRCGINPDKIVCIRNGVDVFSSYPKKRTNVAEKPLRAIFIGRIFHEQKGVFYLPGILANTKKNGCAVTLDIVGDGPDLESLRCRVKGEMLSEVVCIHGPLLHEKAMEMLAESDVILMPSYFEGQPIVLFEAMARGVVPIVSRLNGITDAVIMERENGFLVDIGDEEAFTSALSLLTNSQILDSMSRAAWKAALESFGFENMVAAYTKVIEECRDNRKQGKLPRRSGQLDVTLLGKHPEYPLFMHVLSSKLKKATSGNTGERGINGI
ncbi:MAG: glycosyltransferase family 4 protein [Desulfuromonadales bacterium]